MTTKEKQMARVGTEPTPEPGQESSIGVEPTPEPGQEPSVDYLKDKPPARPYAEAITDEQRELLTAAGVVIAKP